MLYYIRDHFVHIRQYLNGGEGQTRESYRENVVKGVDNVKKREKTNKQTIK